MILVIIALGEKKKSASFCCFNKNITISAMILSSPPQTASTLLFANAPDKKIYWDRSHYDTPEAQVRALAKSSTLYIGNLTFSTRSHDIFAFFSSLGKVKKVHLGLDRYKKTPCGFAFVEYEERECALNAVVSLSGCKLLGRPIRVELDAGFKPGREYGRGASGGQVRDDRRTTVDPARSGKQNQTGGYGSIGDVGGVGGVGGVGAARWDPPTKKREREDDNDISMMQSQSKNPRFAGSDDEL